MFKSTKVHEVKRMWPTGPLRQFAAERGSAGWTAYDGGGFAGSYVCDSCREAVVGVYKSPKGSVWHCAGCKNEESGRRNVATGT